MRGLHPLRLLRRCLPEEGHPFFFRFWTVRDGHRILPSMAKRIRVGVVFGGRSAEHEVSLQSARNVLEALDRSKYEPVLIGIDREGRWHLEERTRLLFELSVSAALSFANLDSPLMRPSGRGSAART